MGPFGVVWLSVVALCVTALDERLEASGQAFVKRRERRITISTVRFGVLGPLEVTDDHSQLVDVGGRQQRLVLAALIAACGRPIGADSLIELLWPDRPPASAPGTLQSYVSRLRRLVGAVDGAQLVFEHGAYRLEMPSDLVDLNRFDALAEIGREELAAGRPRDARDHLAEALEMWRGPALVDLTDQGAAIHQATSLEERRLAALEARIDADLALGRHELIVGELQMLTAEHPLREGLHARLALALYRSGRQAEALRALGHAKRLLRKELGLDPGTALVDLELAILEHDEGLGAPTFASPQVRKSGAGAFVGREAEKSALVAAYEAAAGDAQFVVVEGDPGIGKTRLADEAATLFASHGSCVVWARSNDVDATGALRPWLDVVRMLSSLTDGAPPVLDELLSDHMPRTIDLSAGSQYERFEAIALLLERFAGETPVVVVLDDLQWFDHASLDLLRFLATRLVRGVLVIATLRTLDIGGAGALTDTLGALARRPGNRRLRLSGLSRSATAELVDAVSTGPIDSSRVDHIHERAEGNPFYTVELARLLDEPGSGDADVPATVADTVRRRLHQLDSETLDVLTVAAVVGRDVNLPLVAAVAGLDLDRCAVQLDDAAAHRMLVSSPANVGKLRFAHALVREVLLDGLTPIGRARLHLRVADALESLGVDDIEMLAEHLWGAAVLGVGDRAASALERAAELAVGRVAYSSAEDLLRRALELRREGPAATSLVGRQALLDAELRLIAVMQTRRYFSGTDRTLLRSAQSLALELGHEEISRDLAWSEWASLSRAADVAGARASADRYRQRWASSPNTRIQASVSIVDGVTRWSVGEMTDAIALLDDAATLIAHAPAASNRVEQELALIGEVFGLYCHAAHGDTTPEEASSSFERIVASLPDRVVDGRHQVVYALACRVAAVHTRWNILERFARRALELDAAGQFAFFDGQILLYRSLLEARDDNGDAALATFAEGRARFRAVSGRTGIATCQALLAEHMVRAGRLTDATTLAAAARHEVIDTGELVNDIPVRIAEARVAAAGGDSTSASEHLTAAIRAGGRQGAQALADRAARVAGELDLVLG